MQTEEVFIGLGSNIGDSTTIVKQAIDALDQINGCRVRGRSSLYRSTAVSDIPQDDYINAVVKLDTELQPLALLLELQAIESAFTAIVPSSYAGHHALSILTSSCSVIVG